MHVDLPNQENDGDCALRLCSIDCFVPAFSVYCALDPAGSDVVSAR